MAVNPIQFLVAQNASITDGTKTITVSGNVDCSRVYSGTAIFLGGADNPAEAVSGTSPNGSGVSTITLRNNWSQGDIVNQQLVSFNTNEGLAEAISNVREIVSNVSAIEDLTTQGLIKRISDNVYEVVNISAVGESLITANDAASQRSVLGLGSAATKNVGTSDGNLMQVGAFGLGSLDCPTVNDLTQEIQAGLYKFRADYTGAPSDTSGATLWYSLLVTQNLQDRVTFLAQLITGNSPRLFLGERIGKTGSIRWVEMYGSGNSINPLDYGLKQAVTLQADVDLDTLFDSGLYYNGTVANTPNNNYPIAIAGSLLVISRQLNNTTQRYSAFSPSGLASDVRVFERSNGMAGWTPWVETYHSGNTNFNEFGGNAGNDVIAVGEAVTSTVARFYLPINLLSQPTSMTLTESVSVYKGGGSLETGITSVVLSALSSSKVAVIDVTCSVTLTVDDQLNLRLPTATAKITINP